MQTHIILNNIEDVLRIPNLSYKYFSAADSLVKKIQFYEKHGLYDHDKYHCALREAKDLMIELQRETSTIHYNDF